MRVVGVDAGEADKGGVGRSDEVVRARRKTGWRV